MTFCSRNKRDNQPSHHCMPRNAFIVRLFNVHVHVHVHRQQMARMRHRVPSSQSSPASSRVANHRRIHLHLHNPCSIRPLSLGNFLPRLKPLISTTITKSPPKKGGNQEQTSRTQHPLPSPSAAAIRTKKDSRPLLSGQEARRNEQGAHLVYVVSFPSLTLVGR